MSQSVCFVTPAFERYELANITLEQRKWACQQMKEKFNIDATVIVIANDENIEIAKAHGFNTVERSNRWLGRRFNDGYAFAAKEGFSHVFAIGSDSFIDPAYFSVLPSVEVAVSRAYSVFHPSGSKRSDMWIRWEGGVAFIVPIELYAHCKYRPCKEELRRGCDTSTWLRGRLTYAPKIEIHQHQLELVAFQTPGSNQISSYANLHKRWGTGEVEGSHFNDLEKTYPKELVNKIRAYYGKDKHGS